MQSLAVDKGLELPVEHGESVRGRNGQRWSRAKKGRYWLTSILHDYGHAERGDCSASTCWGSTGCPLCEPSRKSMYRPTRVMQMTTAMFKHLTVSIQNTGEKKKIKHNVVENMIFNIHFLHYYKVETLRCALHFSDELEHYSNNLFCWCFVYIFIIFHIFCIRSD